MKRLFATVVFTSLVPALAAAQASLAPPARATRLRRALGSHRGDEEEGTRPRRRLRPPRPPERRGRDHALPAVHAGSSPTGTHVPARRLPPRRRRERHRQQEAARGRQHVRGPLLDAAGEPGPSPRVRPRPPERRQLGVRRRQEGEARPAPGGPRVVPDGSPGARGPSGLRDRRCAAAEAPHRPGPHLRHGPLHGRSGSLAHDRPPPGLLRRRRPGVRPSRPGDRGVGGGRADLELPRGEGRRRAGGDVAADDRRPPQGGRAAAAHRVSRRRPQRLPVGLHGAGPRRVALRSETKGPRHRIRGVAPPRRRPRHLRRRAAGDPGLGPQPPRVRAGRRLDGIGQLHPRADGGPPGPGRPGLRRVQYPARRRVPEGAPGCRADRAGRSGLAPAGRVAGNLPLARGLPSQPHGGFPDAPPGLRRGRSLARLPPRARLAGSRPCRTCRTRASATAACPGSRRTRG